MLCVGGGWGERGKRSVLLVFLQLIHEANDRFAVDC